MDRVVSGKLGLAHDRLLQDYQVRMVPDRLRCMVTGHQANVKCVDVSGDLGVSGSRWVRRMPS